MIEDEKDNYNIIVIGNINNSIKNQILTLFGNTEKQSDFTINSEIKIEDKNIEYYKRQIDEKLFKGVVIIFINNFDIENVSLSSDFRKILENLQRKGLICFRLSDKNKTSLIENIIKYNSIPSFNLPLFTFVEENNCSDKDLINMKTKFCNDIKTIQENENIDSDFKIYSRRIKFIAEKFLFYKLIKDYTLFSYIKIEDINLQFNIKDLFSDYTINLMVCGRKGAGKSSLINILMGDEVTYADSGNSITSEIREYKHSKYNLKIYDTIGFENKTDSGTESVDI